MPKKYCLDCGSKLVPGARFCSECGTEVGESDADAPTPTGTSATTTETTTTRPEPNDGEIAFCRACGSEIFAAAEVCPECGVSQRRSGSSEEKNPALAALLSFVLAGAGQLYNGDVAKGIVLMVAELALASLIFVTIWFFIGIVFVPILFVVWVYAIWDAWDKAEKINRGEYEPSDSF